MYVYVRSIPVQPLVEKDQLEQRCWLEQALRWPASQPVTGTAAAGPLDTIMHSVPCGPASAGRTRPADSSSLESQPVMVRFQLEVHSGQGHPGDGRGWIRCSQCQADSSSHYDAGGRALALSALRARLPILFSEPTISVPLPRCSRRSRSGLLHPVLFQLILDLMQAACSTSRRNMLIICSTSSSCTC